MEWKKKGNERGQMKSTFKIEAFDQKLQNGRHPWEKGSCSKGVHGKNFYIRGWRTTSIERACLVERTPAGKEDR